MTHDPHLAWLKRQIKELEYFLKKDRDKPSLWILYRTERDAFQEALDHYLETRKPTKKRKEKR